jgi:hypothetical protein
MLQGTMAGSSPRIAVDLQHTAAECEWAYDRRLSIGRLDKGLDEPKAKAWTVVDMQKDWKVFFPPLRWKP